MGKHSKKSRSRSGARRSRSHGRRSRSRSKSHSRNRKHAGHDRKKKSNFDVPPNSGQRKSNWSNAPPVQPAVDKTINNMLFDQGIIKINPTIDIPASAITINNTPAAAEKPDGLLQASQKLLFEKILQGGSASDLSQIMATEKGEKNDLSAAFTILNPGASGANALKEGDMLSINNTILAEAGILPKADGGGEKVSLGNDILSFLNPLGMNPNIVNTLSDTTKIKRKILVPSNTNFNYTGLIIGPKGANQKRLEEETGCKILVRGRGSQKEGQPPQPDDDEPQHVLIVGDNESQVSRAVAEIERIIFADENTRNKLRQEQLKIVAQLKNDPTGNPSRPSGEEYHIPVPVEYVGLVIGKGGETIKAIQLQAGAKRVQVIPSDTGPTRNVLVEGDKDSIDRVKKMLKDMIDAQIKIKIPHNNNHNMNNNNNNNIGGQRYEGGYKNSSSKEEVVVPNNVVGLIIGRGGETIKSINQRTGAFVYIPKETSPNPSERVLIVSGRPEQIAQARQEIEELVEMGQKNLALKATQTIQGRPQMMGGPGSHMGGNGGMSMGNKYDKNYGMGDSGIDMNMMMMQMGGDMGMEASLMFNNQLQMGQIASMPMMNSMQQMGYSETSSMINPMMQNYDPSTVNYLQQLYNSQLESQITETIVYDTNTKSGSRRSNIRK